MRSRATAFLVFCFGFSWPAALLSFLLLQQHRSAAAQASLTFMMAGPGMAGIACALLFERGRRPVALGMEIRPNWWWLLAYGMGIAYSAIALTATVFIGRSDIAAPANVPGFALSSLLINPIVQIVLATLWEELGWRGYLYGLWRRFGFWRCSVGTGRDAWVVGRRGRWKTVCARVARQALLRGRSTSPLEPQCAVTGQPFILPPWLLWRLASAAGVRVYFFGSPMCQLSNAGGNWF